jgi:hypothetical protein
MGNDSTILLRPPRAALIEELCHSPEPNVKPDAAENGKGLPCPTAMLDFMRSKSRIAVFRTEITGSSQSSVGSNSPICHTETNDPPPKLPVGLYETLLLPTYALPYPSTRSLFSAIRSLIIEQLGASVADASLLSYWSMASWFPDVLDFVPRLTVTGPRHAADLVLRLLSGFSRRPVLLASLSPAAWRSIPFDKLAPTVFVRRIGSTQKCKELLDAVEAKGYFVARGRDLLPSCGTVCVYLGEESNEGRFDSSGIHFQIQQDFRPTRPFPTPEQMQGFQNQLFRYRFLHREQVQPAHFTVKGFLPNLGRVAQQFSAVMVDDGELRNGVLEALRPVDEQERVDKAYSQNATVLKAALSHCHSEGKQEVLVREIAQTTNDFYAAEGETLRISNERAGHVLKNAGLCTRRLGSRGRGLVLDKDTRARIHHLAYDHQVLAPDGDEPPCGFCHEAQFGRHHGTSTT